MTVEEFRAAIAVATTIEEANAAAHAFTWTFAQLPEDGAKRKLRALWKQRQAAIVAAKAT